MDSKSSSKDPWTITINSNPNNNTNNNSILFKISYKKSIICSPNSTKLHNLANNQSSSNLNTISHKPNKHSNINRISNSKSQSINPANPINKAKIKKINKQLLNYPEIYRIRKVNCKNMGRLLSKYKKIVLDWKRG